MFKSKCVTRYASILTVVALLALGNSGCAWLRGDPEFNIKKEDTAEYTITDKDILEFANTLQHMFRSRMQYSTIAAYTSGVITLITGTAATVLAASGGSTAGITGLAASSVVSADLFGLFKMKDRVRAYADGVNYLEKAEARYFTAIARNNNGRVSSTELTEEGAKLYVETVASQRLVEKALAAQIPTLEEVQAATGDMPADKHALQLSQRVVVLTLDSAGEDNLRTTQVQATRNGPILTITSEDPDVAVGELDKANASIVNIKPERLRRDIYFNADRDKLKGFTVLTLSNKDGKTAKIEVTVKSAIDAETITDKGKTYIEFESDAPIATVTVAPFNDTVIPDKQDIFISSDKKKIPAVKLGRPEGKGTVYKPFKKSEESGEFDEFAEVRKGWIEVTPAEKGVTVTIKNTLGLLKVVPLKGTGVASAENVGNEQEEGTPEIEAKPKLKPNENPFKLNGQLKFQDKEENIISTYTLEKYFPVEGDGFPDRASGLTFGINSKTLWTVTDSKEPGVYRLQLDEEQKNYVATEISQQGEKKTAHYDLEGIGHKSDEIFLIADEAWKKADFGKMSRIEYITINNTYRVNRTIEVPKKHTGGTNEKIEGVCYDSRNPGLIVMVNEFTAKIITTTDGKSFNPYTVDQAKISILNQEEKNDDAYKLRLSGICYDNISKHYLVLGDLRDNNDGRKHMILVCKIDSGKAEVVSSVILDGKEYSESSKTFKPEGITIDDNRNIYIINDADAKGKTCLYKYKFTTATPKANS